MIELGYRPLDYQDFDAIHHIASDWHVVRQMGSWPHPSDPEFTRSRCAPYAGHGFVWGVITDIGLIGWVGVTGGTLGFMLDRRFWDQGVGTRIVADALKEGFGTFDFDQITASTWFDNAGSIRVLEKNGFAETHRAVELAKARDVPTPAIYFAITRATHNALREASE